MEQRHWIPVESKKFSAADYNPMSRELFIKFHPDKSGSAAVYVYANVEPKHFEALVHAQERGQSAGRYLNETIIGNPTDYPFRKVGAEPLIN